MNLLDLAIEYVSPTWGNKRKAARYRSIMFDAAKQTRDTKDWPTTRLTADATVIPEADTLIGRARGLCLNNGWCRSAQLAYERNVIGTGIQVFPDVTRDDGEPDDDLNARVEDLWGEWSNDRKLCDVEQRLTVAEMQRQLVAQVWETGEQFVRFIVFDDPNRLAPLSLQRIETDSLAGHIDEHAGNVVRGGIEVNNWNAPVAYHFYRRPPNDLLLTRGFDFDTVRVAADQIEHVYLQGRPSQTHGYPYMHAVMATLRALEEFDLWTLESAKTQASLALLITKENADLGPGLIQDTSEGVEQDEEESGIDKTNSLIEPNLLWTGRIGEKVEAFKPSQPGANYEPYVRTNLKNIAAGTDTSHSQVSRDFSDGSYSSLRQQLLEDRRAFSWWQQVIITRFLRPLYRRFLSYLVLRGRVDMPGFFEAPGRFVEADFIPPGWNWIDPGTETDAFVTMWKNGLMTMREIWARNNWHWKRGLRQWAKEHQYFKELTGVDLLDQQRPAPQAPPGGRNGRQRTMAAAGRITRD